MNGHFLVRYLSHYQRVSTGNFMKPPFSDGFPMVFLWSSYGFPMILRVAILHDHPRGPASCAPLAPSCMAWLSGGPLGDAERDHENQWDAKWRCKLYKSLSDYQNYFRFFRLLQDSSTQFPGGFGSPWHNRPSRCPGAGFGMRPGSPGMLRMDLSGDTTDMEVYILL